jgi:hypothetical protein
VPRRSACPFQWLLVRPSVLPAPCLSVRSAYSSFVSPVLVCNGLTVASILLLKQHNAIEARVSCSAADPHGSASSLSDRPFRLLLVRPSRAGLRQPRGCFNILIEEPQCNGGRRGLSLSCSAADPRGYACSLFVRPVLVRDGRWVALMLQLKQHDDIEVKRKLLDEGANLYSVLVIFLWTLVWRRDASGWWTFKWRVMTCRDTVRGGCGGRWAAGEMPKSSTMGE